MRKLTIPLTLVLAIAFTFANPVFAAKSYYAERFDVQLDIQENGSMIVTETVEFRFEGGPFTFAFREISANDTDGLTFLDASMDGVPMPEGTQAGQVEVEAGNPLKVTWHFPATSDASRVFTVRYRVDGVIRKGDADTLIWRVIPEDHDYSIASSSIILTYPQKAILLEDPRLSRNFETGSTDAGILLTASGLGEDEDLILTASFAPDSLTAAVPQWQIQKEQADATAAKALPVGFIAGIVMLLLGGFGLFTYARTNARDPNISDVISTPNPPSDLAPALVAALTKQANGSMGTIFDLAGRGILEIQEEKGSWGTTNYILVKKEPAASLNLHEQGLLSAIFKTGDTQVNMSEISTRLGMNSKLFDEPVEQELIQRKWLDPERKLTHKKLIASGLFAMFLSLAVFVASLILGSGFGRDVNMAMLFAAMAGVSAAIFLISIAVLIYSAAYSVLTPEGEEQAVRWKGFQEYINQVSKGKEPAIRPDFFEKYLAYAAVFGLGASWAKYFQKMDGVPLPIWFHAMAGSHGDFGAIVAVMSASDTSGASGGSGGSAGASGGGSSGAG